jgi:hypothetical protein
MLPGRHQTSRQVNVSNSVTAYPPTIRPGGAFFLLNELVFFSAPREIVRSRKGAIASPCNGEELLDESGTSFQPCKGN